ncbi:hypothetical protein Pint_12191 [Pistacia integerrima]|uniref:Uncharacterized protein n=1 Tax=Pistacia integerrima TaxID=434235 RepID=A0ACC0XG93_9ROSI|nr:hypothetical protein Pint_12191 [Pistacia integerrima]
MTNLTKLEFVALDITGKNYLSWILDVEIHLDAMGLGVDEVMAMVVAVAVDVVIIITMCSLITKDINVNGLDDDDDDDGDGGGGGGGGGKFRVSFVIRRPSRERRTKMTMIPENGLKGKDDEEDDDDGGGFSRSAPVVGYGGTLGAGVVDEGGSILLLKWFQTGGEP